MLSDVELDRCAALMAELAPRVMDRITSERPTAEQIDTKSSAADWVTATDLDVERIVRDEIAERFPGHRIVGEEFGTSGADDAPATWYVDPVDGTTNYVHALPLSSFSICVADEAGAGAGLVADPYRREVLSAVRGRGALRNGEPTRCSQATTLMGGIVLTEYSAQSLWGGMTVLMDALSAAGCVMRILGSNALSVSAVAAGRSVATVIGRFGSGDCLAGALIAAESGARLTPTVDGELFACVAPGVLEELARVWPELPEAA